MPSSKLNIWIWSFKDVATNLSFRDTARQISPSRPENSRSASNSGLRFIPSYITSFCFSSPQAAIIAHLWFPAAAASTPDISYLQPWIADVSLLGISKRTRWLAPLPHSSNEWPDDENKKEGSFGRGNASFSFVVGFRLIEFAMRTVRLGGFGFVTLVPLHIESVDGVLSLVLDISDGVEWDTCSGMLSGMDGVCTGIGRSIDNRDPTEVNGIGTFKDSLRGLMGKSKDEDL